MLNKSTIYIFVLYKYEICIQGVDLSNGFWVIFLYYDYHNYLSSSIFSSSYIKRLCSEEDHNTLYIYACIISEFEKLYYPE